MELIIILLVVSFLLYVVGVVLYVNKNDGVGQGSENEGGKELEPIDYSGVMVSYDDGDSTVFADVTQPIDMTDVLKTAGTNEEEKPKPPINRGIEESYVDITSIV